MMLTRKRPHSPNSSEEQSSKTRVPHHFTFVLESESPLPTDEDSESVYSVQLAPTVSAKDTSDTSWTSDSVKMDVEFEEYEVASISHSDEKLLSCCDSSGTNDMVATVVAAASLPDVVGGSGGDRWADSSGADSDSSTTDSEVPKADYWQCVRCKSTCTPLLRFCLKCFQLRKGYFPERPRWRHPRRRRRRAGGEVVAGAEGKQPSPAVALATGDSGISLGPGDEPGAAVAAAGGAQDEEQRQLQERLCFMCVARPRDGGFIHKTKVHVLTCYPCALRVWNTTKLCPLCKQKPQNVMKLIFG